MTDNATLYEKIRAEQLTWNLTDFDETLCWNSGFPDFIPTEPLPDASWGVQQVIEMGLKPVIFTARPWSDYKIIKDWLENNNFPIKLIICGKPLAKHQTDDKAGFKNWKDEVEIIRNLDKVS